MNSEHRDETPEEFWPPMAGHIKVVKVFPPIQGFGLLEKFKGS